MTLSFGFRKEINRVYHAVTGELVPESWTEKEMLTYYNDYIDYMDRCRFLEMDQENFEISWKARLIQSQYK